MVNASFICNPDRFESEAPEVFLQKQCPLLLLEITFSGRALISPLDRTGEGLIGLSHLIK
jgi:hypothetical protein